MEQWKLIKEWKSISYNSLYCKGDKLYLSNYGRVRLNDIELTLDKGLYISADYEIHIVGMSWPERNIYRTIYKLFVGELHKGSNYNIHHIDFDHYNNKADNLIQLTSKRHGDIHKANEQEWGTITRNDKYKYIYEYRDRAEEIQNTTREWLKQRVTKYFEQRKEKHKEIIELKRISTIERKAKIRQDRIDSGLYNIGKDGRLHRKNTKKKGYITSESTKAKQREATKRLWENEEYRRRCTEGTSKRVKEWWAKRKKIKE